MTNAWDGRPQNPERDGEHVMEVTDPHGRVWHEVWRWDARTASGKAIWLRPNFTGPVYGYEPRDLTAPIYNSIHYIGPFVHPAEIEAREAAAAAVIEVAAKRLESAALRLAALGDPRAAYGLREWAMNARESLPAAAQEPPQ